MQLLTALRNAAQRVTADLKDSNLFTHPGDKGEFREQVIDRYLQPFLPRSYGLGSGQIFSADGASSRQIDIVIYDSIFSNVLFREGRNSLFPCESVFGTIEVKSQLTTEELKISIENIQSVKRLPRKDSDLMDILPYRRLNFSEMFTYDRRRRNPYLGVVFAYGGISRETVVSFLNTYLQQHSAESDLLPDFVFCYEQEYMVFRAQVDGSLAIPAHFGEPYQLYASVSCGIDTLPLFYLTLNVCLNQIHLKSVDIHQYWVDVFKGVVEQQSSM